MTGMNAAAAEAETELGTSEVTPVTETPETETPEVTTEPTPGNEPAPVVPEFDPLGALEQLEIDPKVKEELKKGYLRQSDYTKKTQEIAAIRKAADQYERVRPVVEKLFSDPNLTNLVLGIKPAADPNTPAEEVLPDDPQAYAEYVINKAAEKMRSEFEQREQERVEVEARDRDYTAAEQLDPRLNDENYGKVVAGLVVQNPEFMSGNVSAVEATKQAIADLDRYTAGLQNKAKDDLARRAKEKRGFVAPSSSPATTQTGNPTSMREAAKLAEQDLAN